MFQKKDPAPGVFPNKTGVKPTNLMEQKWGQYRDAVVKRLQVLETERWTLVYTDGSAKQVMGWWQAGYEARFGEGDHRNVGLPVPTIERQSVRRGELRGVLHALQCRRAWGGMVVVLDSEYVYKGITEWFPKWHRHSRRVKSREVGHRDLWEARNNSEQNCMVGCIERSVVGHAWVLRPARGEVEPQRGQGCTARPESPHCSVDLFIRRGGKHT